MIIIFSFVFDSEKPSTYLDMSSVAVKTSRLLSGQLSSHQIRLFSLVTHEVN